MKIRASRLVAILLLAFFVTALRGNSKTWESGQGFLPLATLIDDMGLEIHWHPILGRLELVRGRGRLSFSTESSYVYNSSGRVDTLSSPILRTTEGIYLPLDAVRHLYREFSLPGEIWSFVSNQTPRKERILTNIAPKLAITEQLEKPKAQGVDLIVLDAGHGGSDPGAIGHLGAHESVLVLDLTRRVEKRLKAAGYQVVLTRKGNETLSLEKRAEIANGLLAKGHKGIFISIHANASLSTVRKGFETYYLSPIASSADARSTAALENHALVADLPQGSESTMEKIFSNLLVEEYRRESVLLADSVQRGLKQTIGRWSPDREVKKANFFVMRCIYMPSILVEVGFITNPQEAALLATSDYRDRVADGISNGILEFIKRR